MNMSFSCLQDSTQEGYWIWRRLQKLWGYYGEQEGFEVRDMGNHMVLFIFRDEGDVE